MQEVLQLYLIQLRGKDMCTLSSLTIVHAHHLTYSFLNNFSHPQCMYLGPTQTAHLFALIREVSVSLKKKCI